MTKNGSDVLIISNDYFEAVYLTMLKLLSHNFKNGTQDYHFYMQSLRMFRLYRYFKTEPKVVYHFSNKQL